MKPEVYSCLKMLESLRRSCVELYNQQDYGATSELSDNYDLIRERLSEQLTKEQMEFVPRVAYGIATKVLPTLDSAIGMAIAYLHSLDSSLEKELEAKQRELKLKEQELERLTRILSKAVEAVSQVPEAKRSGWVAEAKKAHREIEENTRQKPEPEDEK